MKIANILGIGLIGIQLVYHEACAIERTDPMVEFQKKINECTWIKGDQAAIFKETPPFLPIANEIAKQMKSGMRTETQPDLGVIKSDAIKFFEKYLQDEPKLLEIAKKIIEHGEYKYSDDDSLLSSFDSQMKCIAGSCDSWPSDIRELIEESACIEDRIQMNLDKILSGEAAKDIEDDARLVEEIKRRYMNPSDIARNFGIEVAYRNQNDAIITTIHETGHVIDIAHRILKKIIAPISESNAEAISMFFEMLARREFGIDVVEKSRMCEIYRVVIQHDYINRIKNKMSKWNGKSKREYKRAYIANIKSASMETQKCWHSPIDELINYIDFSKEETKAELDRIANGGNLRLEGNEYIKHIVLTLDFINNGLRDQKIGNILDELIKEKSTPLTIDQYKKFLKFIGVAV